MALFKDIDLLNPWDEQISDVFLPELGISKTCNKEVAFKSFDS